MQSIGITKTDECIDEIVHELMLLGMGRSVATTLACLRNGKEALAIDLERMAGLRQPEVSIAMRQLRGNGWVSESDKPKVGKGRPNKVYVLNVGFDTIIESLEADVKKKSDNVMASINRLKMLATKKS